MNLNNAFTPLDPNNALWRLMGLSAVMHVTSSSRAFIYAQMQQGRFPRPKKLANRRVAWSASDIEAWVKSRPTAA